MRRAECDNGVVKRIGVVVATWMLGRAENEDVSSRLRLSSLRVMALRQKAPRVLWICTLETQGLPLKFHPVAFLALSANKQQLLSTACN